MTNYERIKSMSVEEMTDFILGVSDVDDEDVFVGKEIQGKFVWSDDITEWLNEEAEM